jgi:hypothetical protein
LQFAQLCQPQPFVPLLQLFLLQLPWLPQPQPPHLQPLWLPQQSRLPEPMLAMRQSLKSMN